LVDEIQERLAPVLLRSGIGLFDHIGTYHVELEPVRAIELPTGTHLEYRIAR
jgi:hypothetical protein